MVVAEAISRAESIIASDFTPRISPTLSVTPVPGTNSPDKAATPTSPVRIGRAAVTGVRRHRQYRRGWHLIGVRVLRGLDDARDAEAGGRGTAILGA